MRKLLALIPVCALVALALAPSSASAWTHCGTPQAEADCPPITTCINGVETQVPDNGQYQPGECPPPPPPKTITVCLNGETITVPENEMPAGATEGECQPVVPPPNPPEAPSDNYVPPEVPPTTPDTPEDTPPTVDIDKPGGPVAGEEQDKGGGEVSGQPQDNTEVAGAEQSTLPFTGLPLGFIAGLGAVVLMGGYALRRRVA